MPRPILMMVTDRRRFGDGESAIERVVTDAARAARAGVDLIQVRERGLDDRRLLGLVRRILDAAAGTGARVLVNERTDMALAAGTQGVHLRSSSPPAVRVRRIVAAGFLIGRSIHSREEAMVTEREGGCDYLLFGTVFPSRSKPTGHRAAGVKALAEVCSAVSTPVLAIGGMTESRAPEVAPAGAAGIAGIELFARDPGEGDAPLRAIVDRIRAALTT